MSSASSSSSSSLVSSSSSSSTSDASTLLTTCLESIVTNDLQYALCVMNSGMFEMASVTTATNGVTVGSGVTVDEIGTCQLMCTDPSMTASASCCAAADKVLACEATTDAISYCKNVIDSSFALQSQCGLSAQNIGLIVACAVIVSSFVALMIVSRINAKRQEKSQNSSSDVLESRFAAATVSTWKVILTAWRQITNLVWKNLIIRRRKPIAAIMEQFLPVLLVTGLVFIANLDSIFGTGNSSSSSFSSTVNDSEAATLTETILCTGLVKLDENDIGAPTDSMSTFYSSGQTVVGIFLLISYIKFVSTTTTTMVIEKETRIREVMKIMGLSDFTLLCSWFFTSAVLSTPLSFVIAAELKYGNIFPGAEYATLVFLFWSLSVAIVSFSYFIAPFFNKSRTASIASVLLWLILFFPFFSVQSKSNSLKYLAALSPPTAFSLAVDELLRRAQLGTGLAYAIALLESPITVPSAFSMSWFLLLDSVILFALGWYLEQVLPQQYGVRKPWNFMFVKESSNISSTDENPDSSPALSPIGGSYQKHASPKSPLPSSSPHFIRPQDSFEVILRPQVSLDGSIVMLKDPPSLAAAVEPVSALLAEQEQKGNCLRIHNLCKEFSTEDGDIKVAVQQLNLTFYSGQITALLGHNGAGKTTTISMLTGLIPPTSGDAFLYGRSVTHNFNELRQIMGICPQHDVLFNELTVEEHLYLFGAMKGVGPSKLNDEVTKMIQEVGLTEKRRVQSKNLSGGQKRKLSVALAFIGDSKLVFLDEPTSGMDPYSRRFTWNLLQRNREGRVMVLTTHFMDEADILGDRIAIMADGQLCCAGSSLFLKNRYGAGYNLTMIKMEGCDVEAVSAFLRMYVPEAKCLSNFGSEVVFQLPTASSRIFATMLQALDEQLRHLRIVQYGVSVTTLEEVFLRIARDREEEAEAVVCGIESVDQVRKTSATSTYSRPTSGKIATAQTFNPTFWTQYAALTIKRFRITKRDRKSLMNSVCIPLLFLIILVSLPEINVVDFLSGYTTSIATTAQQNACTSANFTSVSFSTTDQEYCQSITFSYCDLGVIECDTSACCNKYDATSPYYACNTCDRSVSSSSTPTIPCYNSDCMDRDGAKLQATLNAFLVSLVVMLAFAFIPASIVAFIVREKNPIQNAKSLQLICGADISAYWLSSWTHDMLIILITVVAAGILAPLSSRTLSSSTEVLGVIALVAAHAFVAIPLAYLFSFRFSKHAVAQTSLLVFALSTGGLLSIFSFLCRIIDFDLQPNSQNSLSISELDRNYLRWIFMLFPGYSLNNGIYEIATRKLSRSSLYGSSAYVRPASFFGLWKGLGQDPNCVECWDYNTPGCCVRDVFAIDVAGAPIAYAIFEMILFTTLVFVLENRSIRWNQEQRRYRTGNVAEDDDVARERYKVESSYPSANDSIFIRNLRQQHGGIGGKVALDDLCLAIPKGECFGYLGINGAGKSTTMKVLTGEIAPTNGFVSLSGYDLAHDRDKARMTIGYCPQFDALHDLLTVTEQLELYARLKGIPRRQVHEAVDRKIKEVGLVEYRNKLTRGLSGGNKRKVSTAIALMGAPRIIFLDEPSTGVDPSSRRKMWDVIAAVCAEKESCVVLTTHSMEECEALCTRVGILVSGKLQCLGSVEHLKQKFGRGYTVEVKLRDPEPHTVEHLQREVQRTFGSENPIITQDKVVSICSLLGAQYRASQILNGEANGWILTSYLESSGGIPANVFCSWWQSEDHGDKLQAFFQNELAGAQLIEHQGDHFRFQVPKHALKPSAIFALLEKSKGELHVSEYGVSDTSLEHIFNNMAAQQDEEQVVVNGMYDVRGRFDGRRAGAYSQGNSNEQMELMPSSIQAVRSYYRSNSMRQSSISSQ